MTTRAERGRLGHQQLLPALAFAFVAWVALAPAGADAQARAGVARVGVLSYSAPPSAAHPDPTAAVVERTLSELGYVEGRNILVERRYGDGQPERLAAMAEELVRLKVEVILAGGQPSREAARKATSTIPIVVVSGSDPVREGWAQSLARPGGNVTGFTFTFPELGPKRLELLKEALPAISRVALMIDPVEVVDFAEVLRETEAGARALGVQVQVLKVTGADGLPAAFEAARRGGAQALHPIAMWPHRDRVAALAASAALPTVGESSEEVQAGYLLGYGADLNDLVRRSLLLMDKILKGARPADLPIERPTKFRLSVNLKTAHALGIALPQSLLQRADEVIQ
jgi:putative tryptophan/tyrosine transport system substrate-binding protein